ncbi:MAG TPA: hypothetical protein PLK46_03125 [Propioniciclava sp.]|uniref:hypothetical protein n=1 Tax=Propioniciclava sp. TaxID=2038686 RepID=UPI002C8DB729|nr:hypothetical protein [Propioniciclava sp.]HRL79310.1 hypothetical protein [Propioniciclava sp.]
MTDSVKSVNKLERNELLSFWIKPSSDTEKLQQERAERMVRAAIEASDIPGSAEYTVYTKGSYRNSTNVRSDSDVDVVVELTECFYFDFFNCQAPFKDGTPHSGGWRPATWRSAVEKAMVDHHGAAAVDLSGNIAINLPGGEGQPAERRCRALFRLSALRRIRSERRPRRFVCVPEGRQRQGRQLAPAAVHERCDQERSDRAPLQAVRPSAEAFRELARLGAENGPAGLLPDGMPGLQRARPHPRLRRPGQGFDATLDYLAHRLRNDHDTMEEPNRLTWLFRGHKNWTAAECGQLVLATQSMFGFGAS